LKIYKRDLESYFNGIKVLQKDSQSLKEQKPPRALKHPTGVQFRKEQEEEKAAQDNADSAKAMADLRRKVDANATWVRAQKSALLPPAFISHSLGFRFDAHLEAELPRSLQFLIRDKQNIVHKLHPLLLEARAKAEKSFQHQKKSKTEFEEKKKAQEEMFDRFSASYHQASLAVLFREMEQRLLCYIETIEAQRFEEYKKIRRGQTLTHLENQVFQMREQLESEGFSTLSSAICPFPIANLRRPQRRV